MQRRRHHKSEGRRHTQLRQRQEQITGLRRPDDKASDNERRVEAEGLNDAVEESFSIDTDAACHLPNERQVGRHKREQHGAWKFVIKDRLTVNQPPRCKEEEGAEQPDLPPRRDGQCDQRQAPKETDEQCRRAVEQNDEASADEHHQNFRAGFKYGMTHCVLFRLHLRTFPHNLDLSISTYPLCTQVHPFRTCGQGFA